jgi:tripartite-type tricarboxylate transporter receptor subunit TctC
MNFIRTLLASVCLAIAGPGHAAYPDKPVRMIVPSAPGGGIDVIARLVCQRLTEELGKPFIVDNRPGGGGNIGIETAAKSPRDGYTLLASGSQLVATPALGVRAGYEPIKDFDAISLIAKAPNVLVVHPSVQARSVQELIAFARTKPGEVTFASAGNGSTPHLAGELFNTLAQVKMVHVPYRGTGPALTAILSSEVSVMFMVAPAAVPQLKSGRLRGLAVTSTARLPVTPDLPTVSESGLKGFESVQWYGILAPSGSPADVLRTLNVHLVRFVQTPEIQQRFSAEGALPVGSTREDFATHIKAEMVKWSRVIKLSGARPD